jgi:hypothetical protein
LSKLAEWLAGESSAEDCGCLECGPGDRVGHVVDSGWIVFVLCTFE